MDAFVSAHMSTSLLADPIEARAIERDVTPARTSLWPSLLLAFAATSITIGIIWDISWHLAIGRDTFWTPAHMAIYLGGAMSGCVGGWLAFKGTFLAGPEERAAMVNILGARAPLGAFVAIWGAVAMIVSAPFDNWWHNAYGLDVKILSPPHTVLGLGMFGISLGALLLVLSHQNRVSNDAGSGIFIYVGGIFLALGSVFVTETAVANLQHAAPFYMVAAATYIFRLVSLGRAGRAPFTATKVALVYMGVTCFMVWVLPLFPAQPKLAPIYHPITHMVPPFFPLLLVFPALAIDLILRKWGNAEGVARHLGVPLLLGAAFLAVFMPIQWYFSAFILSPGADNWFFAGSRWWGYETRISPWSTRFWFSDEIPSLRFPLSVLSVLVAWLIAAFSGWIGLLWGNWMRKVCR